MESVRGNTDIDVTRTEKTEKAGRIEIAGTVTDIETEIPMTAKDRDDGGTPSVAKSGKGTTATTIDTEDTMMKVTVVVGIERRVGSPVTDISAQTATRRGPPGSEIEIEIVVQDAAMMIDACYAPRYAIYGSRSGLQCSRDIQTLLDTCWPPQHSARIFALLLRLL
jgi:hypothetical protein